MPQPEDSAAIFVIVYPLSLKFHRRNRQGQLRREGTSRERRRPCGGHCILRHRWMTTVRLGKVAVSVENVS